MKRDAMKTILFIDESESYRFLLGEELSEEGYKVLTADSNEEALSKFRGTKPSLIILEFKQKNAGEESFKKLREQYPNILWIGYSTFIRCPDEFRKWIDFYLPKSGHIDELKVLIRCIRTAGLMKSA